MSQRDAYTPLMKKHWLLGRLGFLTLVAALVGASESGCGQADGYIGPMVRLTGSFNNWAKGEHAPALYWDGQVYRGEVMLPGNTLQLRLYAPYSGDLFDLRSFVTATPSAIPGIPSILAISPTSAQGATEGDDRNSRLNTPLPARYAFEFNPVRNLLRIDFAQHAEDHQSPAVAQIITALRGSDRLTVQDRQTRASNLTRALNDMEVEMPMRVGDGLDDSLQGVLFLHLGSVDLPELSVVGDFNQWNESSDPMSFALDGTIAYLGRVANHIRLEYRFALHGQRSRDERNAEIVWDGAYLPPNLQNLLGGNVGSFNSVAFTPGYVEPGSHLKLLSLPDAGQPSGVSSREVYVYLPAHYETLSDLPSLYIHDGKDAIVRGLYNQALDRLILNGKIPPVVTVFIPAQDDANARLTEYASLSDPYFTDISPKADVYEGFLTTVVPAIESRFRALSNPSYRAMLGADMAGPLTFHFAWKQKSPLFLRLASQSGRFGWGKPSYADLMKLKPDSGILPIRMSFDWADSDNFQVAAQDNLMAGLYPGINRLTVRFTKQMAPAPSSTPWENWRARLDASLTFLLGDLVK